MIRVACSSHGKKISRTSPLRLNSPRTFTFGTRVYPMMLSFCAMFVVSILLPLLSLKERDFKYSGSGKGDMKALWVKIKIRGFSLNVMVCFFERSFESTPALFPKVTEPRAAGL